MIFMLISLKLKIYYKFYITLYEIIVPYLWHIFDIGAHDEQMKVKASCKAQNNDLKSKVVS